MTQADAVHVLVMGGMGGLVMAVSVRAIAHRTSNGMKARRGTGLAFCLIWLAVWARLFGGFDLGAGLWAAGWLLYLALFLPAIGGFVPRPVFSGARNT